MSSLPLPVPTSPGWAHCGEGADTAAPVGCPGIRVPGYRACLAHLSDVDRATYLAGLAPGSDVDHRGTPFTETLLLELLHVLRHPSSGQPHFGTAEFSGASFLGDARFDQVTICGAARFGRASFAGMAEFGGASFANTAEFSGAEFSGDARFGAATFSGDAWFGGASFSSDAWFRRVSFCGTTGFDGASFSGTAHFDRASFSGDARFDRAAFSHDAEFDEASFCCSARFDRASFSGDARFGAALFSGDAWFVRVTFSGDVLFNAASFSGDVRFGGSSISGTAEFERVSFSAEAWFVGVTFFADARFGKASFAADARFVGVHRPAGDGLPSSHDRPRHRVPRSGNVVDGSGGRRYHRGGRVWKSCPAPAGADPVPGPARRRHGAAGGPEPDATPLRGHRDRGAVPRGCGGGQYRRRLLRGGRHGVRGTAAHRRCAGQGSAAVGTAAAMVNCFREAAYDEADLVDVARRLEASSTRYNAAFPPEGLMERFATALLAEIPHGGGSIGILNCGHPPPLLLNHGEVRALEPTAPSPLLNLAALIGDHYSIDTFDFAPGDLLFLYTDGVAEARDLDGEFFPLAAWLHRQTPGRPGELINALHHDLLHHSRERLDDDIAALAVRLCASPEPPGEAGVAHQ